MSAGETIFAHLRLEFSGAAARLARVPLLGTLLRKIGNRVVPRGSLVWSKIQLGPARDFWILLDARSESDLRRGDREPAVQELLKQWLAPGQVFYDIGANVGFFSLAASRQIGPLGRVFAFEAGPDVAARLRNTIQRNHLSNLTVIEAAVWSESGTVCFDPSLASPDRMVGHVVEQPAQSEPACVAVPAISLDDFVRTAPPPHVVKCDVEGAESKVLQGATTLFEQVRPRLICEVHDSANEHFLLHWLEKRRYSVRWLEPGNEFPRHLSAEPKQMPQCTPETQPSSSGPVPS
jgi:FkbM family methyltransferase